MTFSVNISDCAGNGNIVIGTGPWPLVDLATAQADKGVGNYEAIVPLCKVGPGEWAGLISVLQATCRNRSPTRHVSSRHPDLDPYEPG